MFIKLSLILVKLAIIIIIVIIIIIIIIINLLYPFLIFRRHHPFLRLYTAIMQILHKKLFSSRSFMELILLSLRYKNYWEHKS